MINLEGGLAQMCPALHRLRALKSWVLAGGMPWFLQADSLLWGQYKDSPCF